MVKKMNRYTVILSVRFYRAETLSYSRQRTHSREKDTVLI